MKQQKLHICYNRSNFVFHKFQKLVRAVGVEGTMKIEGTYHVRNYLLSIMSIMQLYIMLAFFSVPLYKNPKKMLWRY